ncbi:hypothetical protein [Terrisporobacter sp.]
MTHKKRPSSKKMQDLENEKLEIASELGTTDPTDAGVNVKIASQDEAKFSKKTRTKQHNLNNDIKTTIDGVTIPLSSSLGHNLNNDIKTNSHEEI